MNEVTKMLQNQTVNNFATAFIFGAGTVSFVSGVAGMLFGDLFNTGGEWVWKSFFTALVVYVVVVVVAWWVNSQAK